MVPARLSLERLNQLEKRQNQDPQTGEPIEDRLGHVGAPVIRPWIDRSPWVGFIHATRVARVLIK